MSWPRAVLDRTMMHSIFVAMVCAWLFSPIARADDTWGGSLALTSDYRVRGVSQTRGNPAVQAGANVQLTPHWIVGAWASTIERIPGSSSSEIDAYVGFAWSVAKNWDARASFAHYGYPNDPARTRYDYDELSMSIAYRSQLVATMSWSPNTVYFGRYGYGSGWQAERAPSFAYELTGLQPITSFLSLTAGLGYNDLTRLFERGYWYWNFGMAYSLGPVRIDVSHIDTDGAAEALFGSTITAAGWSAAISWRF